MKNEEIPNTVEGLTGLLNKELVVRHLFIRKVGKYKKNELVFVKWNNVKYFKVMVKVSRDVNTMVKVETLLLNTNVSHATGVKYSKTDHKGDFKEFTLSNKVTRMRALENQYIYFDPKYLSRN